MGNQDYDPSRWRNGQILTQKARILTSPTPRLLTGVMTIIVIRTMRLRMQHGLVLSAIVVSAYALTAFAQLPTQVPMAAAADTHFVDRLDSMAQVHIRAANWRAAAAALDSAMVPLSTRKYLVGIANTFATRAVYFYDTEQPDSALRYATATALVVTKNNILNHDAIRPAYSVMILARIALGIRDTSVVATNRWLQATLHAQRRYDEEAMIDVLSGAVLLAFFQADTATIPRTILQHAMALFASADSLTKTGDVLGVRSWALIAESRAAAQAADSVSAFRFALDARTVADAGRRPQDIADVKLEIAQLCRRWSNYKDANCTDAYFDSASVDFSRLRARGDDAARLGLLESSAISISAWAGDLVSRGQTLAALTAEERVRAQAQLALMSDSAIAALPTDLSIEPPLRAGGNLSAEGDSLLSVARHEHLPALSYLITRDTLFLWFLHPDGTLDVLPPKPVRATALEALIQSARKELSDSSDKTYGGLLETLGTLLLPPDLAEVVPEHHPILIVPQGALGLLPFGALPVRGTNTPFGIRNALLYTPSFRIYNRVKRRASAHVGVALTAALVAGNPRLPVVPHMQFDSLHWAGIEADSVAALLHVPAWTGARATEGKFRDALPMATLVHVATHAYAFQETGRTRQSFFLLATDSLNGIPDHDGIVTVGSILDAADSAPLQANLITLSACETGVGAVGKAEGTLGFQRAFLSAGARNVLVSLWEINDVATAKLMTAFYRAWTNPTHPVTKSEALRLAQERLWQDTGTGHPFFWSAFQLAGAD
jgi:CHAT domain-containing protein